MLLFWKIYHMTSRLDRCPWNNFAIHLKGLWTLSSARLKPLDILSPQIISYHFTSTPAQRLQDHVFNPHIYALNARTSIARTEKTRTWCMSQRLGRPTACRNRVSTGCVLGRSTSDAASILCDPSSTLATINELDWSQIPLILRK